MNRAARSTRVARIRPHVGGRAVRSAFRAALPANNSLDAKGQTRPGSQPIGTLRFSFDDSSATATVTGNINGHSLDATLRRQNPGDFPLMSWGFHWISEEPYVR